MASYEYRPFPYRRAPELDGTTGEYPVAIVGAGPVGLSAAIDLALRGVPSVVLDDNDVVSVGSRAICWAKRTLEIFDRLGVGDRMVAKGVTWKLGRFYHGDREISSIDLLPEPGHKMPAFVNLQQYYVEQYLVERAGDFPDLIDLRWKNKVTGIEASDAGVRLDVETPDGPYGLRAQWVIAADGARSPIRKALGLELVGQLFEERFLIVDVRLPAERPNERHFWFRPNFDPGESVLVHRQPDSVYRVDFQLGPQADPEAERRAERVKERVEAVFGKGVAYELEWASVYMFRCARLDRLVHGRVIFAGDSAHVVSPFGARGGNGGIQDIDNLAWKLALVVTGEAQPELMASYDEERGRGADENVLNSARTTRFMTPKTAVERAYRDAVLALAAEHPSARSLVNGGRLSRPCMLDGFALQSPDETRLPEMTRPGASCPDAPMEDSEGRSCWLLNALGDGFTAMVFVDDEEGAAQSWPALPPEMRLLAIAPRALGRSTVPTLVDAEGIARERYGGGPGVTYLIRPDQHVAARFDRFDPAALQRAHARATGRLDEPARAAA